MIMREKIINAILDCRLEEVSFKTMELYAKMETYDLMDIIIQDLYDLREKCDELTSQEDDKI